ncbi:hypothetical protein, partial [Klebsiella pneumoniae]
EGKVRSICKRLSLIENPVYQGAKRRLNLEERCFTSIPKNKSTMARFKNISLNILQKKKSLGGMTYGIYR